MLKFSVSVLLLVIAGCTLTNFIGIEFKRVQVSVEPALNRMERATQTLTTGERRKAAAPEFDDGEGYDWRDSKDPKVIEAGWNRCVAKGVRLVD